MERKHKTLHARVSMRFFPSFCSEIQLHFCAVPQQCKLPVKAVSQKKAKVQKVGIGRVWEAKIYFDAHTY